MHYLAKFLILGPPSSNQCHKSLEIFEQTCQELGVLSNGKGRRSIYIAYIFRLHHLQFLGITLDTVQMKIWLPDDKLAQISKCVDHWLPKKNATKCDILSLVRLLQHATKVVHCGRTFVSCIHSTAAKIDKLDYYTRLNKEVCSDLWWWHTLLASWNDLS